jgi:hypothetical protein
MVHAPQALRVLIYEHLFIFRKPESEEERKEFKLSIKWWDQQPPIEKPQSMQQTEPTLTRVGVEGVETKLNPYGFLYIPKSALPSLPFKPGDRLHLKIDNENKRVVISSA